MLVPRICRGVLRGLRLFWIGWGLVGLLALVLVLPLGHQLPWLVVAVFLAPLASLVAHEYGHARVALWRGATELTLTRVGISVAVVHNPLDRRSNGLAALGGPASSLLVGGALGLAGWALHWAALVLLAVVVGAGGASIVPGAHDGNTILAALRGQRRDQPVEPVSPDGK